MNIRHRFNIIYKEYYPKLIIFCMHFISCNHQDAEDLVHDILSKAYEKSWRYNSRFAFSTWIYRIARNRCIDWKRKNQKHLTEYENQTETIASKELDIEERLEQKNRANMVRIFMRNLSHQDRLIAYLRFFEEMRYAEVSKILRKPEGTIKYRIHVIRSRLKTYMEEYDGIRR